MERRARRCVGEVERPLTNDDDSPRRLYPGVAGRSRNNRASRLIYLRISNSMPIKTSTAPIDRQAPKSSYAWPELFAQSFEQRVFSIGVIHDGDFSRQVIR